MKDSDDQIYETGPSLPELKKLEVDVDLYQEMLDDPTLTDAHKEQIIVALWEIIIAFVDLGFGVHPVQQACGKNKKLAADSPQESANDVEKQHTKIEKEAYGMNVLNSQDNMDAKAIIYCRVSSVKQRVEGSGLESQEQRCREYAASKACEVAAVFPDDVSGGGDFMKRPGMCALLAYLDAQVGQRFVVIFDYLKRFARDMEFHIKLRREFDVRGAQIECLNFRFEDNSGRQVHRDDHCSARRVGA